MTLREYIRRRNGVPLGHPDSLRMMLSRAFGAYSYAMFWRYWNPIWSYYLSRFIHRPLSRALPAPLGVAATFTVSGVLHDVAVLLISGNWQHLCAIWFSFMGVWVIASDYLGISYPKRTLPLRALSNALPTLLTLGLALLTAR